MSIFRKTSAVLLLLCVALTVQPAFAEDDIVIRLKAFVADVTSFSAGFEQTLYGADGEIKQTSNGTAMLKRPGQLIWRYQGDDAQEIIADGNNIWMYDKELQQVTVNPLDERVNGTPMVVLMGTAALDEQFDLTALGQSDGIDWVQLVPKEAGADFESLFIGLKGQALGAMELRDSFGQATQIRFNDFKPNIEIDNADFQFIPPAGVDVIGEPVN